MTSKQIFTSILHDAIGTTRSCNDGSGMGSFTISATDYDGIADNLNTWWIEYYEDVECTVESATEYFNETYPEIDPAA